MTFRLHWHVLENLRASVCAASIASSLLLATSAVAAPPSATYLSPAGVQRGQTATITVGGKFADWPVQLWTNRTDLELECAKDKGKIAIKAAADAAPGIAWLRLYNSEGASSPRALVVGTLPEINEQEPNDGPAEANEISAGSAVANGRLNRGGEVDTFALTLSQGQTLVAMVDAKRSLGSPMDGVLQITNPDGFVLAQNDDGNGIDPLMVFTAPRDGKYLVRLFAFPEVPTSSINFAGGEDFVYRLTLSTGGVADGALPLALQAGQTTAVRMLGWNIPAAAAELPMTAPEGSTFLAVGHAELGNAVVLPVVPHRSIVEETAADGMTQKIELPATVSGRIEKPGEADHYAFVAKKGDKLSFEAEAHEIGYPLDPQLKVIDAAGKTVSENDDRRRESRDASVSFTAPADGEYRLQIRDLYRQGSPRHFYRITAQPTAGDFNLTLAADSFVAPVGKPLEVVVTVDRQNRFDGEIEVSVVELPAGITATAVKSAAKGDSSKSVKLVLEAAKDVEFSGPLRIVGVVKKGDEVTLRRMATAAVAGQQRGIEDVWVTVAKKK